MTTYKEALTAKSAALELVNEVDVMVLHQVLIGMLTGDKDKAKQAIAYAIHLRRAVAPIFENFYLVAERTCSGASESGSMSEFY